MKRPWRALWALASLLAEPGIVAGTVGSPAPVDSVHFVGGVGAVSVVVRTEPGTLLGSVGGTLSWNATVLRLVDVTGGPYPFDGPVLNLAEVDAGVLRFAAAAAYGATGQVEILRLSFEPLVAPPGTSTIEVQFSSLFSSGSYEDLFPESSVRDGSACIADWQYDLRVANAAATVLDWGAVPGAATYDAVRGTLGAWEDDGVSVSLGQVTCIENGSTDTTTGVGAEAPSPDTDVPLPGEGFYYLVRFSDGAADASFGWVRQCSRERVVLEGGCPGTGAAHRAR